MEIKYFYVDGMSDKISDKELEENAGVVFGLGKIEGFTNDSEHVFMIDTEENRKKIFDLFPQYAPYIMDSLNDFTEYPEVFDGGQYYTVFGKEITIGECINLLIEKINNNDLNLMKRLSYAFQFHENIAEGIEIILKEQLADVISDYISKLEEVVKKIKNTKEFEWE
jgi:hypothetical protein